MPLSDEEILKKYGLGGGGKKDATSAEPAVAPEPAREAPRTPSYEDLDWQTKMGQGVAKGLAITATDIGRLGAHVLPESISNFISGMPGMERMAKFADADYEGGFERAGSYAAQAVPFLMGPGELRLGGKALEFAEKGLGTATEKFAPAAAEEAGEKAVFRGAGRGVKDAEGTRTGWGYRSNQRPGVGVPRPGKWSNPANWIRGGGNLAEVAARGAAGGALGSPDDPVTGAEIGAALGPLSRTAGAGIRAVAPAGAAVAPHLAWHAISGATGAPFYPAGPAVTHGFAPMLRRVGHFIVDTTGRIVGLAGTRAGSGLGGLVTGSGYENTFGAERPASGGVGTEEDAVKSYQDLFTEPSR